MEGINNSVALTGTVSCELEYSHALFGETFYTGILDVERLSGASDMLPVTVSERLLSCTPMRLGDMVAINGQLRSYNKLIEGTNRLILTVFVQSAQEGVAPSNEIELTGFVCKPTVYRVTPFSREICDMLIAVNRAYGKSDYIPCIAWGRNARYAETLSVGDRINITGRVQSRDYNKRREDGTVETRTAYEVSVSTIEL